MKNDKQLARVEKELKLWKKQSKTENRIYREFISDTILDLFKVIYNADIDICVNANEDDAISQLNIYRDIIMHAAINEIKFKFDRLYEGEVLSPLTEDEDEWNDISKDFGTESKFGYKKYQNKRYPELFKNVYSCGKTEYHDNNRVTCYDPIMDTAFNLGLVNKIYDEIFPIEMPYMPGESNAYVNVFCFQSDQKNADKSDFDTVVVMDSETEHEEHDDLNVINRFFREPKEGESPTYGGWVEMDIFELKERIDASAMKNLDLSDLGLDDVYKEACAKKGI